MNAAERHRRAMELFDEACDLAPSERAVFLDRACNADPALRRQVEALLAHDDPTAVHLLPLDDGKGVELLAADLAEESHVEAAFASGAIPDQIGSYRIIRLIGQGGMGSVYEAEQDSPRRRVALKMVRQGFQRDQSLKRFEREANVLGRLQHPGIAQIYEAGIAQTGSGEQPFFAMELVTGLRLDRFVARHGLCVRSRMELVARVCDATHYAHEKGVIHRDLKPSNILVSDGEYGPAAGSGESLVCGAAPPCGSQLHCSGQPKVLDFGVARITDSDQHLATLQTDVGQMVGTLSYMSPEQVSGKSGAVDRRSDIYALGAILHEMLAGQPPLDIRERTVPEAARIIRDEEPTRLGSVSVQFRGDIETIVSKALEKERERRYRTAAELAADIRRFLNDDPILARPPSAVYQVRKFAKRNKGLVAGVGVGTLALMVGLVVAINQAVFAIRARDAAMRETYRASITATASALENHDAALARRSLAMAPAAMREWEWNHLSSRLDESLLAIPVPDASRHSPPAFSQTSSGMAVLLQTAAGYAAWDVQTGQSLGTITAPDTRMLRAHHGRAAATLSGDRLTVQNSEGEQIRRLSSFGIEHDAITRVAVSDGGRFAALISPTQVWRIDFAADSAESSSIDARGTGVDALAVSTGGTVVLASAVDGLPAVWIPGSQPATPTNCTAIGRSVDVSPDGKWMAVGLQDTRIGVWNVEDRRLLAVAHGHQHAVTGVAFSPTGDRIASVSLDRTVRIWDAATLGPLATSHGHDRGVWNVAFSPDGTRLATTGEDKTIRIWDARTNLDRHVLSGHQGFVYGVAFSPDGTRLASAGWDRTIRLWDTRSGEPADRLTVGTHVVTALAFSSDGRYLAWVGEGTFGAWDLHTRTEVVPSGDGRQPESVTVKCLAFFDGSAELPLPWTLHESAVAVWNVSTNTIESWPPDRLVGRQAPFLSRDGRFGIGVHGQDRANDVRTAGRDSGDPLVIVDFSRGVRVALPALSGPFALDHSSSRPLLAARRTDDFTRVDVFDLESETRLGELIGHTDNVYAIAYCPDGKRIATAGRDSLRLWDADSFTEIVQLRGHTSFIWCLAFSRDGTQLASGSGDRTVRFWNARRGATE